jgi:hypothetical protein
MDFPDNCIKGIPNDTFLIEDGSVGSHLFHFKDEHKRDDEWIEQSINWEDDDAAIEFTMSQRKDDGEIQFKAGIVILPRREIERISRQPTVHGIVSYERQPLENNRYHGNILLRADTPKPTMKKIAAGLALAVSRVVRQG